MKRRGNKILALIGACILVAGSFTACGSSEKAADAGSAAADSVVESNTIELSGSIQMVGSTSMEKVANALSETFMEMNPGVTVTAEFVGSGAGIEAVNNGTADVGNSSRSLKDETDRILGGAPYSGTSDAVV